MLIDENFTTIYVSGGKHQVLSFRIKEKGLTQCCISDVQKHSLSEKQTGIHLKPLLLVSLTTETIQQFIAKQSCIF